MRFRRWLPSAWQTLAEIGVICVWAAWIGRSYLDLAPYTWPVGGEWGTQLQTHQLWIQVQRCGLCALWNGGINGGAPALADLFGSMLHPVVMVTTLLWGVVAGAKVALVVALALGGVAQWWIARVLRLGLPARLWSSLLAVAGGHLAGRMENGNFGLVLSTAACSLALAAAFDLARTRERRATLLLAVTGASALVSGQGYMQLALLGWSPTFLSFMFDRHWRWTAAWREYLLAIGLALLLSGIFLVPLLHFWPEVIKGRDPTFRAAQPMAFMPLNLVTADPGLLRSATFGRLPYAYLYNLHIGWLPVVLAALAIPLAWRSARRELLFLGCGTILMFVFASATPLRWLAGLLPMVANVRHTPLIAGLAVPGVLGMAAIGLDRLLTARNTWLLTLPLLWSLWVPARLAQSWLHTADVRPLYTAMEALRSPEPAWVAPPYGELRWTQVGLDLGLKLSPIVWVFTWYDVPMPSLEAVPDGSPPALLRVGPWAGLPVLDLRVAGVEFERAGTLGKVPIYRYPRQHYASVVSGMRIVPCKAAGSGGHLAITCTNEQAGDLVLQEHAWSGWSVQRDGEAVALKPGPWLRVAAPAGTHTYVFRYHPWDVLIGFAATVLGAALILWLWMRRDLQYPRKGVVMRRHTTMLSSRRRLSLLLLLIVGAFIIAGCSRAPVATATWAPRPPPLATQWTAQVTATNALPEYPRPQMVRPDWQNLNGVWQFATATEGQAPPFGQDLAEGVLVPFPIESALSGIQRQADRMWYRRTFTIPDAWKGRNVRLNFGAVDWQAIVYVNGREVGTHRGGYDGFAFDITANLRGGNNELIVGVYDPTDDSGQPVGKQRNSPEGIFYTSSSGIWQTVWLEPVAAAHITRLDMTPDVVGQALRLTVHAEAASGQMVQATALDSGTDVGQVTGAIGAEMRIPVPNPKLWSPEQPFLYDLKVSLNDGATVVDAVTSYFGMRSIGIAKIGNVLRPVLNGEFVFQMGTLDQGFWPDGLYTAPTDEALRFDIQQHKNLGYNLIRKHVKVEPQRWYYWADRLGLLVWQDMPSMKLEDPSPEARRQFEMELREMIDEHRNVTSIVMWVPFNEGWGQYDLARITDQVKQWDPSRLVDNNSGVNCCGSMDGKNGDVLDWHVYVGPDVPLPSALRATVLGEFGGLGLKVEGHEWRPGAYFSYQDKPDAATLTRSYVELIEKVERFMPGLGLNAAVYTQLTDVETELNGLFTYDRAVLKPDARAIKAANQRLIGESRKLKP